MPSNGDDVVFAQTGGSNRPNNCDVSRTLKSITINDPTGDLSLTNVGGCSLGLQSGGLITANRAINTTDAIATGLTLNGPATFTLSNGTNNTLSFGGSAITGTGPLTLTNNNGNDFLALNVANSYGGATTIGGTGRVLASVNGAIPTGSALTVNGSLLFGASSTIGSLAGGGNVFMNGNNTLMAGGDNTSTNFSGVYQNSGGNAELTKTGIGTLALSGINTYAGATTVNAGTLLVNGSLAAGSTVMVASGATLGGSGIINGNAMLSSGGRLAPGNSIGTLSVGGSLTWNGTSAVGGAAMGLFELSNANATSDQVAIGGALLKGTLGTFKFDFLGTGHAAVYTLATFASTTFSATDFSYTNLAPGFAGSFAIVGGQLQFTVVASADLSITKTGPASVTAGQNIVYTIVAKNNGPSDATGVMVSDPTPPGTTFVSNSGACTTGFPCNLGTLTNGQSATITVTYSVNAGAANGSTIMNTATVSSAVTDPNSNNNSASSSATVGASADLSITKTGPPAISLNTNASYTIVVNNSGPSNSQNVVVTDAIPSNTTFVSATPSQGSCSGATTVTCSLGTINAGSSATITLVLTVNTGAGSTVTNTASVTAATADPNMANNSSTTAAIPGTPLPSSLILILAGLGVLIFYQARRRLARVS